jgi:hypothetical protein
MDTAITILPPPAAAPSPNPVVGAARAVRAPDLEGDDPPQLATFLAPETDVWVEH